MYATLHEVTLWHTYCSYIQLHNYYCKYICNTENEVDGEAFLELSKADLEKMIPKVGVVVKLLKIQKVAYIYIAMYITNDHLIIIYADNV